MLFLLLENNNIYVSAINSNKKTKRKLQVIFIFNKNNLIKKYSVFKLALYKNKFFFSYFINNETKERNLFNGIYYGFKSKIKIVGRGWKIIKTNYNTLLIKLGYSHPLFLTLSPYIKYKKKKKKKKYYVFNGVFFDKINTLSGKFNLMRIPDTYTRKGIFNRRYIL